VGVDYVCEWCGYVGHSRSASDADDVQCSQCGEQVVPQPPGSGIVDGVDDF
jgi:DNA-directed RNA polymerase subunit RPC12/RpoP